MHAQFAVQNAGAAQPVLQAMAMHKALGALAQARRYQSVQVFDAVLFWNLCSNRQTTHTTYLSMRSELWQMRHIIEPVYGILGAPFDAIKSDVETVAQLSINPSVSLGCAIFSESLELMIETGNDDGGTRVSFTFSKRFWMRVVSVASGSLIKSMSTMGAAPHELSRHVVCSSLPA